MPVFWRGASGLAIAMVAVVIARLHELIPALQVFRPALVGSAVLFVIVLLKANRETWRRAFGLTATRLLFAYVVWAMITIPFAFWAGYAFSTVRGLLPIVAMFLAVILCAPTRANLDRVQLGFVLALAGFAAGSLVWGERVASGRVGGMGDTYDPNDMATVMAVGFTFAVGLVGRVRGVRRLLLLGSILFLVAAVSASASRGGTVALGVGAIVLAAGQRGRRRIIYLGALGLGAIMVWLTAGPMFRERVTTLLTLHDDYNLLDDRNGRIAVWKRGASYFLEHPIAGVGAGNFEMAEGAWRESRGEPGKWSAAHNAYIQAFVDLGTVGGAIFLSLIGLSAWKAWRLWRPPRSRASPAFHRPELLAGLAAFAVGALFLSLAYSGILVGLIGFIALAAETAHSEMAGGSKGQPARVSAPPSLRLGRA